MRSLLLATALLLAPLAALANGDFEGEWVLVNDKSDNTGLKEARQTIALEDENLHVSRTIRRPFKEPESYEYVYLTSGEEHPIVGPAEFERTVTASWKGKRLEVKWSFEVRGIEGDATETWSMKRKGLEIRRTFKTPMGDGQQKLFFVRADP